MIGALASHHSVHHSSRQQPAKSDTTSEITSTQTTTNASGALSQLFSSMDTDSSSGVSESELQHFVDTMSKETRGALLAVQAGDTGNGRSSSRSSSEVNSGTPSSQAFVALDTNGDGSVSQSELSTVLGGGTASSTSGSSSPTTSDGASAASDASKLLAAMDEDGDGSVSQSELASFMKANAPPPPPPPMDTAASTPSTTSTSSGSSSGETSTGGSSSGSSSSLSAIDTDKDGQISKAELDAWLAKAGASNADGSSGSSGTSTAGSSSTTKNSDALAAVLSHLLQQSYQRMQVSTADLQSSLTQSIDSVA